MSSDSEREDKAVGEAAADEDLYSSGDEEEFKQMERDAKIARDESDSADDDDEEEDTEDENAKLLASGQDLDLPSDESEANDEDLKGDETDDDLEEYYAELGIQDEVDMTKSKSKEGLYKKTAKKVAPEAK